MTYSPFRSLFVPVLAIAATSALLDAQNLVANHKRALRSVDIGSSDVGGNAGLELNTWSQTATFPGLSFQPTQLSGSVALRATGRALGYSAEAVAIVADAVVRDGTWTTLYTRGTPTGATDYRAGSYAGCNASFRIGGRTIETVSQRYSFRRDQPPVTYPLLSVRSPTFGVGPVGVSLSGGIDVTGSYGAGLTFAMRSLTANPVLYGDAYGTAALNGRFNMEFDAFVVSAGWDNRITLGNTRVSGVLQITPQSASCSISWLVNAVRLYSRVWFRVGVEIFGIGWSWQAWERVLYDQSFGGTSGSAAGVLSSWSFG